MVAAREERGVQSPKSKVQSPRRSASERVWRGVIVRKRLIGGELMVDGEVRRGRVAWSVAWELSRNLNRILCRILCRCKRRGSTKDSTKEGVLHGGCACEGR